MVEAPRDDNEELRNRDLSRKPVAQLSTEEKRELKRRFEEFVTAMSGTGRPKKPAPKKPVTKWDPALHGRKH